MSAFEGKGIRKRVKGVERNSVGFFLKASAFVYYGKHIIVLAEDVSTLEKLGQNLNPLLSFDETRVQDVVMVAQDNIIK